LDDATQAPFNYAGDDPVNETDPSGDNTIPVPPIGLTLINVPWFDIDLTETIPVAPPLPLSGCSYVNTPYLSNASCPGGNSPSAEINTGSSGPGIVYDCAGTGRQGPGGQPRLSPKAAQKLGPLVGEANETIASLILARGG
jgi:hypothetical protein